MSVSLSILFDRDNRTFEVGEPVTGRVLVVTDRGPECRAVSLTPRWRTHGLGSTDWDPDSETYSLHEGALPDLPEHEIPFSFPAPMEPLTYHGRQFDVEHSVQVKLRLPRAGLSLQEAEDCFETEGFKVVPGPSMKAPSADLLRLVALAIAARGHKWATTAFSSGALSPELLQAQFSVLQTGADLRRWAAERRIGPVQAHPHCRVVSPGEMLKVSLRFEPAASLSINGATLEVRGQEISTYSRVNPETGLRGETDTREETLFSKVARIAAPMHLKVGEPVVFRGEIKIPETEAFTFISPHHQLVWEAIVGVDIPAWPDWIRTFPLVVWPEVGEGAAEGIGAGRPERIPEEAPAEEPPEVTELVTEEVPEEAEWQAVEEPGEEVDGVEKPSAEVWLAWEDARGFAAKEGILGGEEPPPAEVAEPRDLLSQIEELWGREEGGEKGEPEEALDLGGPGVDLDLGRPEADLGLEEPEETLPLDEPEPEGGSPAGTGLSLAAAVKAIREEKIIGGNRDGLIRELLGQEFSVQVTVGRIDRTMSLLSDPDYGGGRTITGTVADTNVEVTVRCPKGINEEVDSLQVGSLFTFRGPVSDWDGLRRRPNLRAERTNGD